MNPCSPLTASPTLCALSRAALLYIKNTDDDPNPSHSAPHLALRDLRNFRHNTKITRKYLRQRVPADSQADSQNVSYLQITSLMTINCEKLMVTFWPAVAETLGALLIDSHMDAYCRKTAWLYGRQLELLDMLAETDSSEVMTDG